MLTTEFLSSKFDQGLPYDGYVATGSPDKVNAWNDFLASIALTPEQTVLLSAMTREVNVLVSSGTWCGDCVQQLPCLKRIEDASNGNVRVRYLDRDEHEDFAEQVEICGGRRVPVAVFMNEEFDFVSLFGDRSLSRYRAMAERNLGASCPLPGAPVAEDERAATLQDWVDETERVHLLCRLSTKLRAKHGD